MNLLFVEDDKTIQKLLTIFLKSWGIDFDIASNGKEAVELARSNEGKYDLCLMDTDMPEMNGFEAIRFIRKNVKYFPILSTSGDYRYKNKLLEIGADEFISKPYDYTELYQKIIEWIDNKAFLVRFQQNDIETRKEMPMDQKHAQEISQLKERKLVKVKFGTNGEELILHENTTNKISHDFILRGNFISVFLNHHPERPTRCELYKEYCHVTQTYLDDIEYNNETAKEKEEMEKYTTRALKPESEKNKE